MYMDLTKDLKHWDIIY